MKNIVMSAKTMGLSEYLELLQKSELIDDESYEFDLKKSDKSFTLKMTKSFSDLGLKEEVVKSELSKIFNLLRDSLKKESKSS